MMAAHLVRRRLPLRVLLLAGCLLAASPSAALDELILVAPDTSAIPPDASRWVVCYRWDQSNDYVYVSDIRRTTYGETRGELTWADFILKNFEVSDRLYGGCNVEESEADANWRRGVFLEHQPNFPKTFVEVSWSGPIAKASKSEGSGKQVKSKESAQPDQAAERAKIAAELAAERRRAHEEVEARNRANQAKYEADKAAWQAEIDAQKAEEARKQAEHAAHQEQAAREKAAHDEQMAAHERLLQTYDATQRRHGRCVAGDQQACADIAAGKPVTVEKLAEAKPQEASTDTDANRCVTTPEIQLNASFKGNTAASVINGCGKPVDVRICLMTTRGWNCGMTLGLEGQAKWSWSSFDATGDVFMDARTTGSSRAMASPN